MIASLLRSPRLFSKCLLILTMLWSRLSHPILNSSSLFSKPFTFVSGLSNPICIIVILVFHGSLISLINLFIVSFSLFSHYGLTERQNPPDEMFFFFLTIYTRSSCSGRDEVIFLYLKTPGNFMYLLYPAHIINIHLHMHAESTTHNKDERRLL